MIFGVRLKSGLFAHYKYESGVILRDYPAPYPDMYEAQVALRLCPSEWEARIVTLRFSWSDIIDGSVR